MNLTQAKATLTPQQMTACELLVENEFNRLTNTHKTKEEIANEVGVSRQSLHVWEKLPAFATYMAAISDQRLATRRAFVDSQLLRLIEGGNNGLPSVKAIEMYMKLQNRLSDKVEVTTHNQPQLSQAEISAGIEELASKLRE